MVVQRSPCSSRSRSAPALPLGAAIEDTDAVVDQLRPSMYSVFAEILAQRDVKRVDGTVPSAAEISFSPSTSTFTTAIATVTRWPLAL